MKKYNLQILLHVYFILSSQAIISSNSIPPILVTRAYKTIKITFQENSSIATSPRSINNDTISQDGESIPQAPSEKKEVVSSISAQESIGSPIRQKKSWEQNFEWLFKGQFK